MNDSKADPNDYFKRILNEGPLGWANDPKYFEGRALSVNVLCMETQTYNSPDEVLVELNKLCTKELKEEDEFELEAVDREFTVTEEEFRIFGLLDIACLHIQNGLKYLYVRYTCSLYIMHIKMKGLSQDRQFWYSE